VTYNISPGKAIELTNHILKNSFVCLRLGHSRTIFWKHYFFSFVSTIQLASYVSVQSRNFLNVLQSNTIDPFGIPCLLSSAWLCIDVQKFWGLKINNTNYFEMLAHLFIQSHFGSVGTHWYVCSSQILEIFLLLDAIQTSLLFWTLSGVYSHYFFGNSKTLIYVI